MTALVFLFTACSPETLTHALPGTPLVDETVYTEEETTSAELTQMAQASNLLLVDLDDGISGHVEVRPYRKSQEGASWIGQVLTSGTVVDGEVELALPAAPPRRDRDMDAPVLYALALRQDDDGAPGLYTGFAELELVYVYRSVVPQGASVGWNLVEGYGTADAVWSPVSDGVFMGESLRGEDTLAIAGGVRMDVPIGTHLTLTTSEEDGGRQAWDSPIGPEWGLNLDGAPNYDTLATEQSWQGAWYDLYAYADDGDNTWNGEDIMGHVCAGPAEVFVTWFAPPFDMYRALTMRDMDVRAGWDVRMRALEGDVQVPAESRNTLTIAPVCG
jgi:hypothetical protein